jgi:hypothetical protein
LKIKFWKCNYYRWNPIRELTWCCIIATFYKPIFRIIIKGKQVFGVIAQVLKSAQLKENFQLIFFNAPNCNKKAFNINFPEPIKMQMKLLKKLIFFIFKVDQIIIFYCIFLISILLLFFSKPWNFEENSFLNHQSFSFINFLYLKKSKKYIFLIQLFFYM